MSGSVFDDRGYILHSRRYRENSRIIEVLTQTQGRVALVARVSAKPGARSAAQLQPFRELLLRWRGRGELKNLQSFEALGGFRLDGEAGICGLYCNEVLLHLLARELPVTEIFQAYHGTLQEMATGRPLAPALRTFEWFLLQELGYAIDPEEDCLTGEPLVDAECYYFTPGQGISASRPGRDALPLNPEVLLALQTSDFSSALQQRAFRQIMNLSLQRLLGGRELKSRKLIQNLSKYRREKPDNE